MIFQKDKLTGQRLSDDMTLDQVSTLPILKHIYLDVTEDATEEERAFVTKYRLKNDIDMEELLDIVAGNKSNAELKQKIKDIRNSLKPKKVKVTSKKN